MMKHPTLPSAPAHHARTAQQASRADDSASADPQGHGLPGRQAVPGLLERRFPRTFGPLAASRPERREARWKAAVGARMARMAALVRQWRERSRTREVLSRLSDVELRDFGMSRSQIFQEANKPFWKA